jgi:hypothetical protein
MADGITGGTFTDSSNIIAINDRNLIGAAYTAGTIIIAVNNVACVITVLYISAVPTCAYNASGTLGIGTLNCGEVGAVLNYTSIVGLADFATIPPTLRRP